MPPNKDWAAQRSTAAAEHLARLEARQDAEHRQAEAHLASFAAAARKRGLEAERLKVRGYVGSRSARTPRWGWYLRKDKKAGIDIDGNFYHLVGPLGVRDMLQGVTPAPSRPPLVLGVGGRDGDSVALADALDRLLPGWRQIAAE